MIDELVEWVHAQRRDRIVWHVDKIPALVQEIRTSVVPLGSQSFDPRVSGGGFKDSLPMRVGAVDDTNLIWALLRDYLAGIEWALDERFGPFPLTCPPAADEAFREALTLAGWILADGRVVEVAAHDDLARVEDPLFREIRRGGQVYRLAPSRHDQRRKCPVCLPGTMLSVWRDDDTFVSTCAHCGHTETQTVPMSALAQIMV
jgi:ribosomal protein S27AE